MSHYSIVALYSTMADASNAVRDLESAGVASSEIELHGTDTTSATSVQTATTGSSGHGFFDWLFGSEGPEYDRQIYHSGVTAGGAAVAVHLADDSMDHQVRGILQRYNPVDVDERLDALTTGAVASTSVSASAGYAAARPSTIAAGTTGEEIAIPVVEEQLAVGKREVEAGRVRVRTYTREIPVEESINLRRQWVAVEHRPVAAGTAIGADAFKDRTIDMVETAEEAVVAKTARVTDEVVIRRGVEERTETIRDTVRRTEVDVQRDAGTTATTVNPAQPVASDPLKR